MNNYYKQIADLQCANERLKTLHDKQRIIFDKYFPVTVKYKSESSSGGGSGKDKMSSYLNELEETGIDKDMKDTIKNISSIQDGLKRMEVIIKGVEDVSGTDGLEYKVINLKYYDVKTYTLQQIADKLNYSIDRIKQVSADIEKKIKENYYTKITQ